MMWKSNHKSPYELAAVLIIMICNTSSWNCDGAKLSSKQKLFTDTWIHNHR